MPYTERYVAFADILGFSNVVKATAQDAVLTRYDALVKVLTEIGKGPPHAKLLGDDFQFQSFSDSVVMSSRASPGGLIHLLSSITELAIRLLENGLLLRGAVTKGKLHHDNVVMFGPAFLDAYRIETTIAKYPRVILSADTYADLKKLKPGLLVPHVLLADDGPPYLHIFAHFQRLNKTLQTVTSMNSEEMFPVIKCWSMIQNLLNASIHDPRHYEKLRWLAIYWNETVGALDDDNPMIVFPNSPWSQADGSTQ